MWLTSIVGLGGQGDLVTCSGCGSIAPLTGPDGEPLLVYSLNSLVDRVLDQDCLGHILVARKIEAEEEGTVVIPGATLSSETVRREVDILGLSHHHVFIGEVKATHGGFTARVIRETVRLAKRAGSSVVVFATLGSWSDLQPLELQRAAHERGLIPRLYQGKDLVSQD